MRDIKPLVAPRSIAVIGASTNPNKSGGILFSNLANGGFSGKLYPINPNASEIMGLKAYAAIGDLPEKVDLVYIVLPSQHMETAIQQCVDAGARAACIITAGFSEAGPIGKVIQDKIRDMAKPVGHAARGSEHDWHGQHRMRNDGKLRQLPALGKWRDLAIYANGDLHRRAHASDHGFRNSAVAGV